MTASHSCTLGVTFTPALGSSGNLSGAVVLADTASVSPQILDVKGTAVLPLTLAPTTLTFTTQTVGTASAAQTVTITNNLASSLSPVITGSGDYSAIPGGTTPCAATLLAHASCTFTVTFIPSAVGTRSSNVTVTDSSNPGVQTIAVSGIGQ